MIPWSSHLLWMKLLGPVNWKRIQMVNYLTFIIVSVHFILVLKGDILSNALLGLGLITIILQFWGFFTKRDRIQKMKQTTPNS
jgi:DMSO/TMAO reductase YedYZ heme-binding membrane subunit